MLTGGGRQGGPAAGEDTVDDLLGRGGPHLRISERLRGGRFDVVVGLEGRIIGSGQESSFAYAYGGAELDGPAR